MQDAHTRLQHPSGTLTAVQSLTASRTRIETGPDTVSVPAFSLDSQELMIVHPNVQTPQDLSSLLGPFSTMSKIKMARSHFELLESATRTLRHSVHDPWQHLNLEI